MCLVMAFSLSLNKHKSGFIGNRELFLQLPSEPKCVQFS